MKTSLHNDHLSQQELRDALRGKSDARVEKLLKDCELSKEALAGFTAFPDAMKDVSALNKEIGKKSGMIQTPKWMSVATIVIGVALVAGIAYALWPHEPEISQHPEIDMLPVYAPPVNNPEVDLTPKAEHFVNPEAKSKPVAVISPGKPADSVGTNPAGTKTDPIAVNPPEQIEVKPVVPVHPEAGYNASIGFIHDLKITEFDKYYRNASVEVREPFLKGVPAQFEDEDKLKEAGETETVRNIPAEKFLNEGLLAFHDGKYGRCIEKMDVLKKFNDKDLNATFYTGVSYFKLDMNAKAISMFDEVLNAQNNVFHEEAKWYKALALIGDGQKDAAKVLLNEIAAKEGFYKEKAALKLKEISGN